MTYLWAVSIAIDQLLNAILRGAPDETLSSRAYRCGVLDETPKKRWVKAVKLIDMLFFLQVDHCRVAYESELSRKHMVSHFRVT